MSRVMSILCLVLVMLCAVSPTFAAQKEWTWMVFLNADNNLDSFGVGDQEEMAKVGSNDWLNIVSLIDRENGPASLNYIEKGAVTKVKDMGELDMGDYKVMVNFVKETMAAYPAKHYALIIWNHGSGWKSYDDVVLKGISYDDSTGNHITTEQLGLAMNEIKASMGRNFDVLGMDACLMQMMEVAYAVKTSVDYVVASEETEPGEGYPYDGVLGALKSGMGPAEFTKVWVKAYAASYNGGSQGTSSTTQSSVDCSKLSNLKDAIDGFAKASMAGAFGTQFKDALLKVQKFYYRTNVDLLHLVKLLKATVKDEAMQNAAGKLEDAYSQAVVANATTGSTMKNASGLAVYFPSSSYSFSVEYNKLAFAQESLWDEMVQDFYKKTTAPTVVADIENGDISSLINYVQTANSNNREVSSDLVAKLNFRVFTEGGLPSSTQDSVKTLISELKTK
ncbi:hypothetical protein HYY75_05615 [bacterium]|nr:hypothetical protein [bacterium]